MKTKLYDGCMFLNEITSINTSAYSRNKMEKPKFLDIKKSVKNNYKNGGIIGALIGIPIDIIFRIPEYIEEHQKYKKYISQGGDKFLLKKFVEDNIRHIKRFYGKLYKFEKYKKDFDYFVDNYSRAHNFEEILIERFWYEYYNPFYLKNEIALDELFISKFKDQFDSKDLNGVKKVKAENNKILAYTYKRLKEINDERIAKEFNDDYVNIFKKEEQFLKSLLAKVD